MQGPFGSSLQKDEQGWWSELPDGLAPLFTGAKGARVAPTAPQAARAGCAVYSADGGRLRVQGLPDDALPVDQTAVPQAAMLERLADVGGLLGLLHQHERSLGELDWSQLWQTPQGTVLRMPAQALEHGALLRWRLSRGEHPETIAHSAPEVLDGQAPTPASDVYALAALAFELIAERPALGQLHPLEDMAAFPMVLRHALHRALRQDPAKRPALPELVQALRATAQSQEQRRAQGMPAVPVLQTTGQTGSMSGILVLLLLLGGIFAFVGAIGFVTVGWDALGDGGRLALLFLLTGGIAGGGFLARSRGYTRSGLGLLVLSSQLLWANVAYVLMLQNLEDDPGAWTLASAFVTAVGFLCAWRWQSALMGVLSAAGFLIAALCLGAHLSSGTVVGATVYVGLVALAAIGVARLGDRLGGLRLGVGYALLGVLCLGASACLALGVFAGDESVFFGLVWPYLMAGVCGLGLYLRPRQPYYAFAAIGACLLGALAPTVEALVRHEHLPFLLVAAALGLGAVALSFLWPRLRQHRNLQLGLLLMGLFNAVAAPGLLALVHCAGHDGGTLLAAALEGPVEMVTTDFVYIELVLGIAGSLIALGWLFSEQSRDKLGYRLVEVAGLLLFFGVMTLLSLFEPDDYLSPLVVLVGGLCVLGLGMRSKRAALVLAAAIGLLVNLSIQYFAKLSDVFPIFLLVLGFGLGFLALGILYERKIRHLLPELKTWS